MTELTWWYCPETGRRLVRAGETRKPQPGEAYLGYSIETIGFGPHAHVYKDYNYYMPGEREILRPASLHLGGPTGWLVEIGETRRLRPGEYYLHETEGLRGPVSGTTIDSYSILIPLPEHECGWHKIGINRKKREQIIKDISSEMREGIVVKSDPIKFYGHFKLKVDPDMPENKVVIGPNEEPDPGENPEPYPEPDPDEELLRWVAEELSLTASFGKGLNHREQAQNVIDMIRGSEREAYCEAYCEAVRRAWKAEADLSTALQRAKRAEFRLEQKKHYRYRCSVCHAPKGPQVLGQDCNNNCGGRVIDSEE